MEDLQAGVAELKDAAPLQFEERHNLFLLKKQVVDTLVEWVPIRKKHNIKVEIGLNLFAILDQDADLENLSPTAYSKLGGIILVYMIYAALGNSVYYFEAKNMQFGHKFDINMVFA